MTTPTPSALSATGQQLQESQKTQACPKAKPNRRLHRSTDPRRAEGHCTGARPSGLFFWTVHCAAVGGFAALRMRRTPCGGGPLSFRARPIRGPAAPRAVGRGGASKPTEWARKCPWGARERAQFSHWGPRRAPRGGESRSSEVNEFWPAWPERGMRSL